MSTALSSPQMLTSGPASASSKGFTVTRISSDLVQPLPLVTVTVKLESAVGLTVMVPVVSLVLQRNEPVPDAVSATFSPSQMVSSLPAVSCGNCNNVTVAESLPVQL